MEEQPELPRDGETPVGFARRLESAGHDEMFIRRALRDNFELKLEGLGEFFDDFEDARLRHLKILHDLEPNRSEYSFAKKVSENLGISQDAAQEWVRRFKLRSEDS